MKIAFFNNAPYWGGLANNGGTLTILKSSEAIRKLGHEAEVVASIDKHTWTKHLKPVKEIPKDADVCVAVSVSDIKPMLKQAPRKSKKVWWMRGMETWQMSEYDIRRVSKKVKVICNASHLIDWLGHGELCFSGLDIHFWKDTSQAREGVGGLINNRHKTKHSDWIRELADKFAKGDKTPFEMKRLYNECKVWLACSTLEGFHQCPAEAALSGCLVIGVNRPHSGTGDWLNNSTGHLFNSMGEAINAIRNPDYGRVKKAQEVLRKIGSREKNMKKFIKILEKL